MANSLQISYVRSAVVDKANSIRGWYNAYVSIIEWFRQFSILFYRIFNGCKFINEYEMKKFLWKFSPNHFHESA